MYDYSSLEKFFSGDHLELRKSKALGLIKRHCDLSSNELLKYISSREGDITATERGKIMNFVKDLGEVYFMSENLHLYLEGLSKVSSDQSKLTTKSIEIKNQGQWITRHLPAMWDASILFTRFDTLVKNRLFTQSDIGLVFFEAVNKLVLDTLKPPYAYLKLFSTEHVQTLTLMILAASFTQTFVDITEDYVEIDETIAKPVALIQAHSIEKIQTCVSAIVAEYERAALREEVMGENDETLRLIDDLEILIKNLKKEIHQVVTSGLKPVATSAPALDVEGFKKEVNGMFDKLQGILKRRLGG